MKSQLHNHLKYTIATYLRYYIQKFRLGKIGKRVHLDRNVRLLRFPKNIFIDKNVVIKEGSRICSCNKNATIKIGENTTIGYHSFIFASDQINIGSNCLIAPFTYIVDSNHKFDIGININQQPNESAPIYIGNDVWVASNVTILKGITIEDGAVIATNSVVNSDIPKNAIYGGSPAKLIGMRK